MSKLRVMERIGFIVLVFRSFPGVLLAIWFAARSAVFLPVRTRSVNIQSRCIESPLQIRFLTIGRSFVGLSHDDAHVLFKFNNRVFQ